MAVESFRPITWQPNEVIDEAKMDRFASNQQYLFEQMPRARYSAFGVRKPDGVKMACGLVGIGSSKKGYANNDVHFGNFFASGCRPVITTGIVSLVQFRIHCTIKGLGQLHPDQRGFTVHVAIDGVNPKNNKIVRNFYVSWIAMGY